MVSKEDVKSLFKREQSVWPIPESHYKCLLEVGEKEIEIRGQKGIKRNGMFIVKSEPVTE